ncbi:MULTISPECIES: hypothetical protein [unclassified Sphingopyxis]|uniref:hypothetical protein n=1 Tax=unclassified Sphingopyxis TaxID=2614943 RepID=UPI0012E34183|nr:MULTISPECIES: hypothetical protein [unclassified Sphingopyxis]
MAPADSQISVRPVRIYKPESDRKVSASAENIFMPFAATIRPCHWFEWASIDNLPELATAANLWTRFGGFLFAPVGSASPERKELS